jgi:hypothetical protein
MRGRETTAAAGDSGGMKSRFLSAASSVEMGESLYRSSAYKDFISYERLEVAHME